METSLKLALLKFSLAAQKIWVAQNTAPLVPPPSPPSPLPRPVRLWKFRTFNVPNGTILWLRLLRPDPSHCAFGFCSCKQDTKERYLRSDQTEMVGFMFCINQNFRNFVCWMESAHFFTSCNIRNRPATLVDRSENRTYWVLATDQEIVGCVVNRGRPNYSGKFSQTKMVIVFANNPKVSKTRH